MKQRGPWLVVAGMLLAVAVPAIGQAQPSSDRLSLETGLDFTNGYYFRGIRQERTGMIAQPYAGVNWTLHDEPGAPGLHRAELALGVWNSLHTGPTGSGTAGAGLWYESDFLTSLTLGLDNWEAGVTVTRYLSPNDAFADITELALSLAVDDSPWFSGFPLQPYILLAIELDGQADGGDHEGVYVELGLEPEFDLRSGAAGVQFPVRFGLSLNNYYENGSPMTGPSLNDGLGYIDVGARLSYSLAAIPAEYGDWEVSGGGQVLLFGRYLKFLNDGDGLQAVGTFGVSVGF